MLGHRRPVLDVDEGTGERLARGVANMRVAVARADRLERLSVAMCADEPDAPASESMAAPGDALAGASGLYRAHTSPTRQRVNRRRGDALAALRACIEPMPPSCATPSLALSPATTIRTAAVIKSERVMPETRRSETQAGRPPLASPVGNGAWAPRRGRVTRPCRAGAPPRPRQRRAERAPPTRTQRSAGGRLGASSRGRRSGRPDCGSGPLGSRPSASARWRRGRW